MSMDYNERYSKGTLPFDIKHLPDAFREKAEKELNESKENIIKGLQELKKMTHAHKTTCSIEFIDDFLLQFLRHRKYDVNRAFKQLVNCIQLINSDKFMFGSVDIDKFFLYPTGKFFTVLPHRCQDGCVIGLYELGKWEPDKVSIEEFERLAIALLVQSLRQPMTQINGFKFIYDFRDTAFKHLKYCTPYYMQLLYRIGMDCIPGRYKEVHIVNPSLTFKTCWMLVKGFMSPKLKRRMIFHSTPQDVLEFFPSSIIPVQYGGLLKDYHMTEWLKYANEQQGKFSVTGQHNFY